MTANRSLDDFADVGSGESSDDERGSDSGVDDGDHDEVAESADPGSGAGESVSPAFDPPAESIAEDGVEDGALAPPASTYAWSPDGGPCGVCGETVGERWRDGDDLVCAGCKDW